VHEQTILYIDRPTVFFIRISGINLQLLNILGFFSEPSTKIFKFLKVFCTTSMSEEVSRIHKTDSLDQQLFCWRHFSKTEDVQNTDLNILAL
jgi:hypothetical protein